MIIMDNVSWHHSEKIVQICRDVGVILEFLPPYSPDFNPIEHFGVLKKFINKSGTKTRISLQGSSKYFWSCASMWSVTMQTLQGITSVMRGYLLRSLLGKYKHK
jgi:hypothetical protein